MDCNRDEAIRAQLIAEDKFGQNDFDGAMKFALKAEALYPGLTGISHMLATLNIFVSAQKKINGEIDWYGVLSVDPSADDETIRKRYKKLALLLHPDKNHSAGADGAFKLVSEAKDLLLDKAKRLAYNQITGREVLQPKVHTQAADQPTAQPGGTSAHASGPSVNTAPPTHAGGAHPNPFPQWARTAGPSAHTASPSANTAGPSAPSRERVAPKKKAAKSKTSTRKNTPFYRAPGPRPSNMFWTTCQQCQLHFEYPSRYKDSIVMCRTCYMPFFTFEIPRPLSKSRSHIPKPWPPRD